ncbi:hypothetical protein E2626_04290 [Jeotgalibacillus salarius]|uniref:Uncharacterized protein n=1 Tax=Jeotgalibacillus salarius TaxID=546023 RepID=A0A4Y8LJD4_9BACL|nr:hypothetical protein [Jeotgalibacillus salarius]TFE03038.1 hypothetical protein E2626_04290 [Jeotgalibacillus salarius]
MHHNPYHVCATCIHFKSIKMQPGEMIYFCKRLKYETQPHYTFNCWEPKDHVKKLMQKRRGL